MMILRRTYVGHRAVPVAAILLFLLSGSATAQQDEQERVTAPGVRPTWMWAALQLLPSVQYAGTSESGQFGMQWQVTPLLYSFGMNRRLSPWRSFVVEPLTRQNGSAELFVAPEYTAAGDRFATSWLLRAGVRAYVPLIEYGEYLSASIGGGYAVYNGQYSPHIDAGVHIFFGVLGLQVSHAPELDVAPWTLTLKIRYF